MLSELQMDLDERMSERRFAMDEANLNENRMGYVKR